MGLTVTEDTPADMLAGNMELLVQLPPRNDDEYDNDENYDGEDDDHRSSHHRNHHRHHNHHHNGHQRRTSNGNARRVIVARSTPMMDLLVQVATSQKLSASSYTLEAIGEHGLVLTHHPNTPIGALDALQVKLLPKQGTFVPMKARHVNQPFETTFRLQVHLPRNQLYVSRVSSRMNLGKILDEVCREKNLDRNNYELCHPANIEETLDLSLSLQDYHLQEVTLCPKRRSLGSSLSSQDIMALQRQEERRRQDAKQSVFGFAFKKSKESSLSTDSLGERSVSPTRSDGTGRSASPQAPAAPTRPQRKRRPAPKPPMPHPEPEPKNGVEDAEETRREREREGAERIVISHSRNSSDSSGYHEASVLSDNLDSNIRVPETLPRRGRLLPPTQESTGRTLAESSQASKSLGNLAAVQPAPRIARVTSSSSISSAAGLRKKKAAPAPPQPRPLSSAISSQALERIVDSEESFTPAIESPDVAVAPKRNLTLPRSSLGSDDQPAAYSTPGEASPTIPSSSKPEVVVIPSVETPSDRKHKRAGVDVPVPKPRGAVSRLKSTVSSAPAPAPTHQTPPIVPRVSEFDKNVDARYPGTKHRREPGEVTSPNPIPVKNSIESSSAEEKVRVPIKPRRKTLSNSELDEEAKIEMDLEREESNVGDTRKTPADRGGKIVEPISTPRGEGRSDNKQPVITMDRAFDDLIMRQNVVRRVVKVEKTVKPEPTDSTIAKKPQIVDGKRSCAVISTIPKCGRFQSPKSSRKVVAVGDEDGNPDYDLTSKVDSGLGSSFGTGRSIFESNYQRDLEGAGTPSATMGTNGTDDELELEDFEMFERSMNFPKLATLNRSHSELNNFEINTFQGNGRHLTGSGDLTFALNANLARKGRPEMSRSDWGAGKHPRKHLEVANKSQELTRNGAPQLPAFFTTGITWEREDLLQAVRNDTRPTARRLGEPGSDDDVKTVPVTANAEATSDLLKKVSDTLSESLRSPEAGVPPSLANDQQPLGAQRCVDEPQGPGDAGPGVNGPKPLSEYSGRDASSLGTGSAGTDDADFLENRQTPVAKQLQNAINDPRKNAVASEDLRLSSTPTIDWEYPIPEPPSAFRDTAVLESPEVPAKKTLFIPDDVPEVKAVFGPEEKRAEVAKPNGIDIRPEELAHRPRTVSVTSSESRRGSQASSTPTVAPVDNTLSNFVITTYSRPKNVDIFDEVREVETPISRKNSSANSNRTNGIVEEARKYSTESKPRASIAEEKSSPVIPEDNDLESSSRTETLDGQNTVNRSDIKISIATKPRPRADAVDGRKIVDVKTSQDDDLFVAKEEIAAPEETAGGNQKFSKWRENILKKHETPTKETQMQSAQVLKSILPQLEEAQRNSDTHVGAIDKSTASNTSEEKRVIAAVPKTGDAPTPHLETNVEQTSAADPPKEPIMKRYTYAGPPAIDLGSWSDRSRTTRVQIKPDSDYKFEKSRTPEAGGKDTSSASKEKSSVVAVNKTSGTTTVLLQNSTSPTSNTVVRKSSISSTRVEKESKDSQPNELAKALRGQTAGGFRRPVSVAVDPARDGDKEVRRIFNAGPINRWDQVSAKSEEREEEIDARPISFKELKQAFAKDHAGSASIPKYGSFPRRPDTSATKFAVRRDSFNSSNAEPENVVPARINKPLVSTQEKRSFAVPAASFRNGFLEATRRNSRGTPMPVVKGFKSVVAPEEEEKRLVNRIAIGDISNGNYVASQNGLRKTVQIKTEDFSNGVPKPPTMPVITGVTLKSTNYNANTRPKSMPVEPDDRNQLLESIRNFGPDQLKRVPRRNTNVVGLAPGSRSVRS